MESPTRSAVFFKRAGLLHIPIDTNIVGYEKLLQNTKSELSRSSK
jgi:hypothetical protein